MQFLTQKQAALVDEQLMGKYHYSLEQLMELAGLAVAQTIFKEYPPTKINNIHIVCGPGNNGGDGLVAARHLTEFGYNVSVCYPKQSNHSHLKLLVEQLHAQQIEVTEQLRTVTDLYVDAIFGFSFHGPLRGVFVEIISKMNESKKPIVSVDIPSGWDVENGYTNEGIQSPNVVVSLSAPKNGVKSYKGIHYLGGRFIPKQMQKDLGLELQYPGDAFIMNL
ncbi:NAD(P)H-hydrate epimerase [Entamoeba marina]